MDRPKLKSIQITVVLISRTLFPLIQVVSKNGRFRQMEDIQFQHMEQRAEGLMVD